MKIEEDNVEHFEVKNQETFYRFYDEQKQIKVLIKQSKSLSEVFNKNKLIKTLHEFYQLLKSQGEAPELRKYCDSNCTDNHYWYTLENAKMRLHSNNTSENIELLDQVIQSNI